MPVTQTSASAFQQDDFLFVLGDVADIFTRFGVVHHRAAGHFNHLVRSVFSETAVLGTGFSVTCQDVTVVLQMEQRPVVAVTAQDDMASSSSVTSVGASVGYVFLTPHMRRTSSALSGAAIYFYVVNKIRFSHILFYCYFTASIALQTSAKISSNTPKPWMCWYLPSCLYQSISGAVCE